MDASAELKKKIMINKFQSNFLNRLKKEINQEKDKQQGANAQFTNMFELQNKIGGSRINPEPIKISLQTEEMSDIAEVSKEQICESQL